MQKDIIEYKKKFYMPIINDIFDENKIQSLLERTCKRFEYIMSQNHKTISHFEFDNKKNYNF